ncbi:hypothetical protein GCM10011380_14260 [Sphingomonas metalli]|uniref:Uncharacterized protein n=1 Tax=Sphingomonas metalli TaxID=1779358 RepID=A0A916WSJ1_9SPHN|nr:hypothetical protein [Sphingomonas metalli]GGB25821.1 hypothetical protein GCM10011380_14260 [Sphingomonas metalli]
MSEVDDAIAAARASWARITEPGAAPSPQRTRTRRAPGHGMRRLKMIVAAALAIVVAAFVAGIVAPIGIMGAFLALVAIFVATATIAAWPAARDRPPPPAETLRKVDIKALPAQTERWLAAQRAQLPAPAQHLVDRIGERLDTLSPQLARVEPEGEAALEIRRLVGEQLPAFVGDYARVPEPLRRTERNGRTPDTALIDGLALIEREIAGMTERLAQGDLDSLQTRGRFLEMKYSGDAE